MIQTNNVLDFEPHLTNKLPNTGSRILRYMQAKDMDIIDLLVRESIQNSLDAASQNQDPINVHFNIQTCDYQKIKSFLPQLEIKQNACNLLLEIRDTGTQGLTGPAFFENKPNHHFSKLVYDLGNPQTNENGGGSFGLGKTVYYYVGFGLVIFYSQICENGVYQQRLAACLIENESKKYRYLPKVASGIGWWGIFQDEKKEITQAITDPIKIKSILDLLNIKPFLPKETGSSIIIPNLRPDIQQRKDLVSDIALSVKRWYCIRLNHKSYPYGKTLTVNITDKDQPKIDVKNDRSIFEIIQKLYMQTQIKPQSQIDADTTICPISINDTFITPECGYLISKKFDLQSLRMMISNSNDASAFSLLLGEDIDNTPYPILIGYLRSPGMILSWNDSDWSKDLPKTDEITIALFIPHHEHEFKEETKAKLKEKDFNLKTFEQYLRSTEKANHIKWLDHSGFNIIKRVKDHVVKSLRATYGNQSQINPQKIYTNLTLQRRLATLLMPDDWGKDPTVVNPKPPIGGGRSGPSYKKEKFEIINIVYQATQLILDWKIHDLRKKKIVFKLKVQTENKTQDLTDLKLHQQNSISFSKQFTIDYLNQNEYLISFKEIVNSKIISEIEITLINKIQNIEGQLIILKNHDYLLPTIEVTYGD